MTSSRSKSLFLIAPLLCAAGFFFHGCEQPEVEDPTENPVVDVRTIWRRDTGETISDHITIANDEEFVLIIELHPKPDRPHEYEGQTITNPRSWPVSIIAHQIEGPKKRGDLILGTIPLDYPDEEGIVVHSIGRYAPRSESMKLHVEDVDKDFDEDVIPHWLVFHSAHGIPGEYEYQILAFPAYQQVTATAWDPKQPVLVKRLFVTITPSENEDSEDSDPPKNQHLPSHLKPIRNN
ncbi:hypothetical protein AB1L42_05430 [Thalassoglobus sp. JC818]|uniref:hypothetical protein n=1 Tax=Thalassoglobus sp. JC818 TaxID=3232136 RepID=UPI0034585989